MTDDLDSITDDIISQLQNTNPPSRAEPTQEELDPEELEKFILNNAATLINDSVQAVAEIRNSIGPGSDPREVMGLAEVIKATASAIESLNKVYVTREKIKSSKELKKMDIDSKQKLLETDNSAKLLMNREDLMKQLFRDVLEVEGEVIDPVEVDQ